MGAAVQANDLRSTTASAEAISQQNAVINQFARDSCLSLSTKKNRNRKDLPHSLVNKPLYSWKVTLYPPQTQRSALEFGGTQVSPQGTLSSSVGNRLSADTYYRPVVNGKIYGKFTVL